MVIRDEMRQISGTPMILGLGIDLVELSRIRSAHTRFGERFARRILTDSEWEYCRSQNDPVPSLAARFAAKEAVSKAFGTGISETLGWRDMEVLRLESGQPQIRLLGPAEILAKARGCLRIHLSLTHTRTTAAAVAVLEG